MAYLQWNRNIEVPCWYSWVAGWYVCQDAHVLDTRVWRTETRYIDHSLHACPHYPASSTIYCPSRYVLAQTTVWSGCYSSMRLVRIVRSFLLCFLCSFYPSGDGIQERLHKTCSFLMSKYMNIYSADEVVWLQRIENVSVFILRLSKYYVNEPPPQYDDDHVL